MESRDMLAFYAPKIEAALSACIPQAGLAQQRVADAMRYSLLGGGKRLRGAFQMFSCAFVFDHGVSVYEQLVAFRPRIPKGRVFARLGMGADVIEAFILHRLKVRFVFQEVFYLIFPCERDKIRQIHPKCRPSGFKDEKYGKKDDQNS